MPLKIAKSRESMQTLILVNMFTFMISDHTYSYKQSYTNESCQNEICSNESIYSAHCETFSQCQPSIGIRRCLT